MTPRIKLFLLELGQLKHPILALAINDLRCSEFGNKLILRDTGRTSMSDSDNNHREKNFETLKSALIGILFLIVGWIWNGQQRIEDKLYQINATAMTETKAQSLEDRISRSIDVRFSDLSNRLDLILKLVQAQQQKENSR